MRGKRSSPRAVKPISRSQWNAGYGADAGPSEATALGASRPLRRPVRVEPLGTRAKVATPWGGGKNWAVADALLIRPRDFPNFLS
jgi:hypothetical protein